MTIAAARREVKSVPAQVAGSARRSASDRTGVAGSPGRRPDPGGGVSVGLALALEPAAGVPDAGEPSSGRVAGVALADLDQPAPDVLAVQLGRPDLGMVLGQPVGQAAHRVLVALTVLSA
jgi:hypothetical protein